MVPADKLSTLFNLAEGFKLALFPIPAWCKQPLGIVGSHTKDCSLRRRDWEAWYKSVGGCNFGMECGPGRVVVPDLDTNDDGKPQWDQFWLARSQEKETFLVQTPSGGYHFYYRIPDGIDPATLSGGDWSSGIEVQIGNEYVVAPFSQTRTAVDPEACDGAYVLINAPAQLPIAPPELIEHCLRCMRNDDSDKSITSIELEMDGLPKKNSLRMQITKMLDDWLGLIRQSEHGEHNTTIYKASFALGRVAAAGQLDREMARALLIAEGVMTGHARHRVVNTVRSGLKSAQTKPKAIPTSLADLLVPFEYVRVHTPPPPRTPMIHPDGTPKEPVVERLLLEGNVTILSGGSGTGKTTLGASLMAASTAGIRNFDLGFGEQSDVILRPAAWVFASYEGGQYIDRHRQAWHAGVGREQAYAERQRIMPLSGFLVWQDARRNVFLSQQHHDQINKAIEETRAVNPGLPVVFALDNLTSAVSNFMDAEHAQRFMTFVGAIAALGVAVLIFSHPPKSDEHPIIGSLVYRAMADIVGVLEVVRKDDGGWSQWIDFEPKHRHAPNGQCLELKSRRLKDPIMTLPLTWGASETGRARALEDLRIPYIYQIKVRQGYEKALLANNVVTGKKEHHLRVVAAQPQQLAPGAPFTFPTVSPKGPPAP